MAKQMLNVIVKDEAGGLAKPICPQPALKAASEGAPWALDLLGRLLWFPWAKVQGLGLRGISRGPLLLGSCSA